MLSRIALLAFAVVTFISASVTSARSSPNAFGSALQYDRSTTIPTPTPTSKAPALDQNTYIGDSMKEAEPQSPIARLDSPIRPEAPTTTTLTGQSPCPTFPTPPLPTPLIVSPSLSPCVLPVKALVEPSKLVNTTESPTTQAPLAPLARALPGPVKQREALIPKPQATQRQPSPTKPLPPTNQPSSKPQSTWTKSASNMTSLSPSKRTVSSVTESPQSSASQPMESAASTPTTVSGTTSSGAKKSTVIFSGSGITTPHSRR